MFKVLNSGRLNIAFCGKSMELNHVQSNLIHEFFQIQSIGIIPLEQFQDVLTMDVYKRCQSKSWKTLSHLRHLPNTCTRLGKFSHFLFYFCIFHVHHYLITLFIPLSFFYCFFHLVWDFNSWKCCYQVVLWGVPWGGGGHFPIKLKEWMEKGMEQVNKD